MNTSQRTSNSDMILRSSEFSLGHTDSPETTSDVVAVLILCSVHFVLRSPEDYIPLSTSILLRNSLRNYRTFDLHPFLPSYSFEDPSIPLSSPLSPLDLQWNSGLARLSGRLHLSSLMPSGILRYTPSAFSSIRHLLADTCPSLMKTPLITIASVDPLDHSRESPEYRLR
ncbi:hypothetical protein L210DRAFT_3655159 [Boletus edulis BED1]|uniref:Uncharacterized protein n=1 Tax=Boletus edulis BED1 TaxID=1328754 RepID=A0AAD4BD63_BOLED|nr:hypothetical protein L210DRAFT_3655159 [Boletus edulis BED1]